MPEQVCTSASMKCTFGAAPSSFVATPRPVMTSHLTAGVITDNIPITNVPPFGTCLSLSNPAVAAATSAALGVLTPQPCVPVLPSPWKPGAATVMICNIKALDKVSTLNCAWGGVITFASAGQTTHLIP
jgi:Domain of unknown function (DUF4280)